MRDTTFAKADNMCAKEYLEPVKNDVYFIDAQMQSDAKQYSDAYNKYNPKRKIDFIQLHVLEFIDRDYKPVYHLEAFLEGDYEKHRLARVFIIIQ